LRHALAVCLVVEVGAVIDGNDDGQHIAGRCGARVLEEIGRALVPERIGRLARANRIAAELRIVFHAEMGRNRGEVGRAADLLRLGRATGDEHEGRCCEDRFVHAVLHCTVFPVCAAARWSLAGCGAVEVRCEPTMTRASLAAFSGGISLRMMLETRGLSLRIRAAAASSPISAICAAAASGFIFEMMSTSESCALLTNSSRRFSHISYSRR